MSQAALSRIWTVLGSSLLLYVANVWAATTGAGSWSTFPLLDGRPNVSAYHGIIVSGVLLAALCGVGIAHARRSTSKPGLVRLPVVSLGEASEFDPKRLSFLLWQILFLVLFVGVPTAGLLHFHKETRGDAVVWNDAWPAQTSMKLTGAFDLQPTARPSGWPERFNCPDLAKLTTTEGQTRTMWLADRPCDLYKWQGIGRFAEPKGSKQIHWPLEEQAMPQSQCVLEVAAADRRECSGQNDLSSPCEKDLRACRGVQWLPWGSPIILSLATALGWGMVLLMGVATFSRAVDRT